jgi:hypothetical protein
MSLETGCKGEVVEESLRKVSNSCQENMSICSIFQDYLSSNAIFLDNGREIRDS